MKKITQRLLALDVLRGITIAGMILVNNPGNWSAVYAPLQHASWNGLTPTDLVFPFFMFIMGISTYISLKKYDFAWSNATAGKIIKRTVVIFAIGLGIAWFSLFCRTWNALAGEGLSYGSRLVQSANTFDRLRILGVMPRLALCYGATALIALLMRHKNIAYLIAGLLLGYFFLLLFGNGFAYDKSNVLSIVDRAVLGASHMYRDNGIEPEGLLSTIPAISHVLIGFLCGWVMMETSQIREKILRLLLIGAAMSMAGFLLSYGCPINKKIWSPTFVLATCGLASSLLGLLIWIIDVKGKRDWSRFFEAFGVNPLFMYVLGAVFSILMANFRFAFGGESISLQQYVYGQVLRPALGDYGGSLAYAILFVSLVWAIGYILYRKKIYIKI
jgi:predicted acyltransferase